MRRVEVGFFSFTEVPAHAHRAYNEWHQLDHLPEQYAIDGIAHGQRWVATPACAAARAAADDEVLARAQYVTLYLVTEPVEATLVEFRQLAVDLRAAGRFFAERESHLFGPWRVGTQAASAAALVRAEVVPWRPCTGVYVVVDRDDERARDLDALCAVDGVAGAWAFDRSEAAPLRVTVAWLDGDVLAAAAALAPLGAGAVLAGPYESVTVGCWDWFEAAN